MVNKLIIDDIVNHQDTDKLVELFKENKLLILPIEEKEELAAILTNQAFLKNQFNLIFNSLINPIIKDIKSDESILQNYLTIAPDKKTEINFQGIITELIAYTTTGKSKFLDLLGMIDTNELKKIDYIELEKVLGDGIE